MTQSILSNNLKQLMRIHGNLSVSELARLTNIPQPTIHHMLFGSTKNPRKKALEALSVFFSISMEQLIGEVDLPQIIPENIKKDLQLKTIPILEWDTLKNWPNNKNTLKHTKEILFEKSISPDSFSVVIHDPSMESVFPLNSLLIFDAAKVPKDRDFVVVRTGENNSILFNRFFTEDNESYIKQKLDDGNAKLIKLNMSIDKIVGVLTEVRIQY